MRTIVYALVAWCMVLSLATAGQYVQTNRGRSVAREDSRQVWRVVICYVEAAQLKNPKLSSKAKTDVVKFWTALLVDKVHTQPCS